MKLTILTEDNTSEPTKFLAEHGLCIYIEDDNKKILFDTGASNIFIKNSLTLGINLLDLDYIVLSHGHYDHTWGLASYMQLFISAVQEQTIIKKPTIITHPATFLEKFQDGIGEIGCLITEEKLKKTFKVITTKEPYKLTNNITFIGEIPKLNDFEADMPIEKVLIDGTYQDDYISEDSALIYENEDEISIITGCSHSGICNIIQHAEKLTEKTVFKTIIGGFHLLNTPQEKLNKIINYLLTKDIKEIFPCHCTDWAAKMQLSENFNTKPVEVGTTILY